MPSLKIPKKTKQAAKATIDTEEKNGKDLVSQSSQPLDTEIVGEGPCMVTFGAGFTQNTGNYNSVKVYCEIAIPCDKTEESIEEAYENATTFVNEKLATAMSDLEEEED